MQKDDLVYVGHMLDTARAIVGKVSGKSRLDFDGDDNLRIAIAHLVQTVGEAARRVSPAFQQAHPEIPWKTIIAMRHKVVHDYLEINFDIVWRVATVNLPPLVAELEKLVPGDTPDEESDNVQ
jgi:uncharacterized protein with HEPN domain